MFGKKKKNAVKQHKTDLEQIIEDYVECIRHLYRGENPPFVNSFKDDYYYWLNTDIGLIELDNIPHDNAELTERRSEIECLIADGGYSNDEIIERLNDEIKNQWKLKSNLI